MNRYENTTIGAYQRVYGNSFLEDLLMIIPLVVANIVIFQLPCLRPEAGYSYMFLVGGYVIQILCEKQLQIIAAELEKHVRLSMRLTIQRKRYVREFLIALGKMIVQDKPLYRYGVVSLGVILCILHFFYGINDIVEGVCSILPWVMGIVYLSIFTIIPLISIYLYERSD